MDIPRIPVSGGLLSFARKGRLLTLKPTYKSGWTIPGGVTEAGGETRWDACQREVHEECSLAIAGGSLACVDFRRPRPGRPGGVRFLFDCGAFDKAVLDSVVLQAEEISACRLAGLKKALPLLSGPIRRRVRAACAASTTIYLEEGRSVPTLGRRPMT